MTDDDKPRRTDRQAQVWELYQQGLTKEQIAERLGISPGSVHNHLSRPHQKRRRPRA